MYRMYRMYRQAQKLDNVCSLTCVKQYSTWAMMMYMRARTAQRRPLGGVFQALEKVEGQRRSQDWHLARGEHPQSADC